MEERDWLILTTLYENKNITKTARDLFISQPALTNRLQQIEDEFKAKIVNRGSRGVSFTMEGQSLVSYANEMLLSLKDECLNVNWFMSLEDARIKIENWRKDYNELRPHGALTNMAPS